MKKCFLIALALALVAGFVPISAKAVSDTVERGFISVNTTANTEITPDVADISIAVKTYDNKSLQKATTENKEISERVLASLKTLINTSNGDYVKTINYSASPLYTYSNNKRNFDKYEVSNTVIVHTKSIDKVGEMIDKAISLGATNVNDITFSISAYDKQCNDLLNAAAKKAYTRAEMLAASSYGTLSGIKSLNGSCTTSDNARVQYRMLAKNMSFGASADSAVQESSSPIQGGVIKLFANVNASYFVK